VRTFRILTVAGAAVAWMLAMLGSWTRINGAGMTCPDWPLCRGAVVPVLHGGVVLEWAHRALAGVETLIVVAAIAAGWSVRRSIPGLAAMLAVLAAVFVLQIALGGVTIFAANSPLSVTLHWGTAMLLITTFIVLAIAAFEAGAKERATMEWRPHAVWLGLAAICAFFAMCAGALVSSSGAGLACPAVPACGSTVFGTTLPQALQMTHRTLAGFLIVFAIVAALFVPASARRATIALRVALVLLALQVTLGVLNVVLLLPPVLREAHAANAVATYIAFVCATVFALLGHPAQAFAPLGRRGRLQPG
jgi:heme A synthase